MRITPVILPGNIGRNLPENYRFPFRLSICREKDLSGKNGSFCCSCLPQIALYCIGNAFTE